LDGLEVSGMDISSMTKGLIRTSVGEGMHTIDVGLLVAPIVHEFIKQAATAAGLEVDDGFKDKGAEEARIQELNAARASKILESLGAKPKEVAQAPVEETPVEMEMPTKRGLMAREEM
jgi:hypothetical protein